MSIYTSVTNPILDVTAKLRGRDDPADPRPVRVGHDVHTKDVVLVLDPEHARRLATLLAQLDSNPDRARDVDELRAVLTVPQEQQDTWMHALVDVLASVATAANESVDVVPTDAYRLRSIDTVGAHS